MEGSTIASLFLMVLLFHFSHNWDWQGKAPESKLDLKIEVADIPPTEQIKRPPPPPRPSIAIPTESEDIPEDETIPETELNMMELPPPPPPPKAGDAIDETFVFVPYDEPPAIIGGTGVLYKNLRYPEIARKAGVEGYVVVGALIDTKGDVIKTMIMRSSALNVGFEEAAQTALMKTKWKPAMQRDRKVKVWISITVRFKLTGTES
jgi:protein TonB